MTTEKPTVEVDAKALLRVLQALIGPPHYIRELQATRGLPGFENPIDILIADYNKYAEGAGDAERTRT